MKKVLLMISITTCLSVGAAEETPQEIKSSQDINLRDNQGCTPLHQAIFSNNSATVKQLIANEDLDQNLKTHALYRVERVPTGSEFHLVRPELSPLLLSLHYAAVMEGPDRLDEGEEFKIFKLLLEDSRTKMPTEEELRRFKSFYNLDRYPNTHAEQMLTEKMKSQN